MKAIIGHTVIPHISDEIECFESKEYYIWRIQADSKVRLSHRENDGKIFHINNPPSIGYPGEDYNCRCYADHNIPSIIEIEEETIIKQYCPFILLNYY